MNRHKLSAAACFVLLDMGAEKARLKAVVRLVRDSEVRRSRPSEIGSQ